jgi:hypothetical protein
MDWSPSKGSSYKFIKEFTSFSILIPNRNRPEGLSMIDEEEEEECHVAQVLGAVTQKPIWQEENEGAT